MNIEEFIKLLLSLDISIRKKEKKKNSYSYASERYQGITSKEKDKINKDNLGDYYLHEEWRSGGVGGGSCYDEGEIHHHAIEGEPEPDFVDLDKIFEEYCPEINFLKYKRLLGEVVEHDSRSENEYYGNSTSYGYKIVNLKKLYEALTKNES